MLDKARLLINNALEKYEIKISNLEISWKIIPHKVQFGLKILSHVKNIILVGSGKGGVGKSTISVNLSLALAKQGAQVGILDGDIYGPSIPTMLGISDRPKSLDQKNMEPLIGYGLQTNSIGFLINPDSPAIWRGPMVAKALEQLLYQTNWFGLDYLIIDMPPGTGDIALTLAQKVPVVGAVIVTTPQDISLIDARRCLRMFQKIKIPILGIIENMAMYICTQCNRIEHIFGEKGGQNLANQYNVPWLGSLPLTKTIREQSDIGIPIVESNIESIDASYFLEIARRLAINISVLPHDMTAKIPPIVVKSVI
ncbi:MAG: iron-sulfur cluster carrier protein ApbC [Bordetella sp.]|nr:MAG: iron-sulfur cluster carrier protein ApbC [Bordetella sp.]